MHAHSMMNSSKMRERSISAVCGAIKVLHRAVGREKYG
jgi:hypothetical protein